MQKTAVLRTDFTSYSLKILPKEKNVKKKGCALCTEFTNYQFKDIIENIKNVVKIVGGEYFVRNSPFIHAMILF